MMTLYEFTNNVLRTALDIFEKNTALIGGAFGSIMTFVTWLSAKRNNATSLLWERVKIAEQNAQIAKVNEQQARNDEKRERDRADDFQNENTKLNSIIAQRENEIANLKFMKEIEEKKLRQ